MPGLSDAIGELFIKVRPDTTTFGAETAAGVGAQSGAASRGGTAFGKKMGLAMGVAATAAVVKGIGDFTGFERGMNEVFTLIPDAGQDAFDSLEAQTKSFAKETGNLTDVVIPSLYDSISAGVPRENVFSFLEDANEFAKAGATDLSTAVDGFTTGLNAYGLEADQAGRVSDALFTGVKLGKTTVEELSASLFQVAPIANVVGVDIEQVSASLATLTAQGTPTKVAATQMKAAFTELSREGTKASDAFVEMSGQSFTDFIAGGGNIVEAAALMSEGADEAGQSILDLFGSVEAGQAIVGLSSDLEKSASNLAAVNDAAGATEEAFEQMEKGIGPALDKLKATVSVAFIDIGDAIAPVIMAILPPLGEFLSLIADLPGPVLALGLAGLALGGAMLALAGPILKVIQIMKLLNLALLANPWVLLAAAVVALAVVIYKNWDTIKETVGDALDWIADKVEVFAVWLGDAWDSIYEKITPVLDAISAVWSFTFNAMSTFIESWQGRLTALWENFSNWFGTAFQALSDFIMPIWNFMWDMTIGKVQQAWEIISGVVSAGVGLVTSLLDLLLAPIGGIGGALQVMQTTFQAVFDAVKGIMQDAYDFVVRMAQGIGDAVSDALGPVGDIAGMAGGLLGGGARLLGFDTGGVVPGPIGSAQLAVVHGGETILPTHKDPNAGAGGGTVVNVSLSNATIRDERDIETLAQEIGREMERKEKVQGVRR